MLIDARKLPPSAPPIAADVCIIGGGVAGVTLAGELAAPGRKVVLLESGGLELDERTQALYRGAVAGDIFTPEDARILSEMRLRYLGGTSNHWSGECYPLQPRDFLARPWVADSGWPIAPEALAPHYRAASRYHKIFPDFADPPHPCELASILTKDHRFEIQLYQATAATRFGEVATKLAAGPDSPDIYLHANVVAIRRGPARTGVTAVAARTLSGIDLEVRARLYVLATGAVENARLLLLNDIGNEHDVVGRYFTSHLYLLGGTLSLTSAVRPSLLGNRYLDKERRVVYMTKLSTTFELEREHRLRGFAATLDPIGPEPDAAFRLPGPVESLLGMPWRSTNHFDVNVAAEQTPCADSRVVLGDERDELGQRRVRLTWKVNDEDVTSLRKSLALLGQLVGARAVGRLYLRPDAQHIFQNVRRSFGHKMGTTRMHADPRKGVVDENCRVHGIDNLFVAGSSVFTSCGTANPTLTLTALAIRLAAHLRGVLA